MTSTQPTFELDIETQATYPVIITGDTTEPPLSEPYNIRYLFWRGALTGGPDDDIPGIRWESGDIMGWAYSPVSRVLGSTTIEDNTWYLCTMTCDGVDMNAYINGSLDGTALTNIQDPVPYSRIYIGRDLDATRSWWGAIDDVRIYNRVLSSSEITNLYSGTNVTNGLIHNWEFEDNYLDSIGTAHGTALGNPTFESGVYGKSLFLDGYTDGVDVGTTPVLPENAPWTISLWARRGYYKGRSEKWQIELTATPKAYFGYGYGVTSGFQDPSATSIGLDYFNVLGISGLSYGYGVSGTETTSHPSGGLWGWGYEWANAVLANGTDSIDVCARVLENGIPQAYVKVTFLGSPDVTLDKNTAITDTNGYACISASLNPDVTYDIINSAGIGGDLDNFIEIPISGIMMVKAMVEEKPELNNRMIEVETSLDQLFYEQAVSSTTFQSYGYQHYSYAFGIWA